MKLRINAKLRAALIAAIATVGFTLPQTFAATTDTTLTTTFGNCAQGTATSVTLANAFADAQVVTIPGATVASLTKHTNGDTVSILTSDTAGSDATFFSPNSNVGNNDSWKLTLNYTNAGDIQSINGMTLSVGLFNSAGKWQTGNASWVGNETFTATVTANGVTKSYTGNLFAEGQAHKGQDSTKFAVTLAGETLDLSEATDFSVVIDLPDRTLGSGCFVGLQNIGYNVTATTPGTPAWQGTDGSHSWVAANFNPEFADGKNAIFGEADCKTVTVDQAVSASKVTVSEAGYTFELNNNLTAGTLAIAEDGSLALSGTNTMAVTSELTIADGGSLTVGAGSTVKLGFANAGALLKTITGAGNITLTANTQLEGVTDQANPVKTLATGTLTIDNCQLKLGKMNTGGAFANYYVDMTSFSGINLNNGTLWVHTAPSTLKNLTASGTSTIYIQDQNDPQGTQYLTLAGTTTVNADSKLIFTGAWKAQSGIELLAGEGTLELNGPNPGIVNIGGGTIGLISVINNNSTANITGDLALGGLSGTQGTVKAAQNLTFTGSGTYSYTGTFSVGGQITKTGAGSQTISGTALHHTILAQEGKLVLDGTYAIDDVAEGAQVAKIVDYEDHDSDNGFRMITGSKIVYSDAGTVLDLTNAHFTYQTQDVTQSVVDNSGVFALPGESIKSTVYVTKDSLDIANYKSVAGEALTSVELSDGTTVNMDAAVTVGVKLAEGASATVNATAATTLSGVTGLGEGQTLTISGTAPVTIGSAITGSTVSVNGGTLNLGNYIHNLAALNVVNGTVSAVGVDNGNGCVSGTISIGADGVFQTTGHHDVFGYNNNATDKIVMGGTGSDHMATLELTPDGTGVTTMTTDIEMNGYAAITTKNGFNTYNGAITATGVENSIDQMYLRSSVIITVNGAESELTIGKLKRTNNFDGTITKEGEGTLVFNGTENVIDKTITVNAGTLALDGTFSIGGIAGTESATYDGGVVENNGFKTATTTRTVYTKSGEGANVIVGQDAHFMVGEDEVQLADDGTYTSAAETDYTKFYVNSGAEAVSTALDGHQPTAFALAASTSLQVDESIAATVTGADATSVVTIGSDKVLTGTAANVTIAGSGTYVLNNATSSLGTGVALANDWTGIVSVIGANYSGAFSTGLSHEGSWIELKGTKGYLTNQTITNDIILSRGEDDWAFQQNNGNNGHVIVFAGTLVGDGNLGRGNGVGSTYTYEFTGDISGWTGQFISRNNNNNSTTFKLSAAEAMEVGATLVNKGTDFYVAVNTDATFNAGVEATKVTVAEGKTATFAGETTIGTIEGPGSVVVGGDATLTVTGSVAEGVQIEAESGATIAGEGIDASQVGIAAEGTATFVDGIAQESGIVFSEGAVVTNNGAQAAAYNTELATMTVTAETLYHMGDTDVEIANKVVVDEIVNVSGATLKLANAETTTALKSMTIGYDSTVAVYSDAQAAQEGTVTISESLTAGHGAVLAADLELLEGSALDVSGTEGAGLTMGSNVGLNTGDLIAVTPGTESETDIYVVDAYLRNYFAQGNELYTLFTGVDDFTIDGILRTEDLTFTSWLTFDLDAASVFDNLIENTYALVYSMGEPGEGTVALKLIPEPATGTLSLLALAALAARRRKH